MTAAYRFRAADASGRVRSGVIRSTSRVEAERTLMGQGLLPMAVEAEPQALSFQFVRRRELALMFRSLATLLDAGLSLDRTLMVTASATPGRLGVLLSEARTALSEGQTLAAALAAGDLVPATVLAMLRSGERAGRLGGTLAHLAGHLEQESELRDRLLQALAYPAVLLLGGVASCLVIGLVVIPRFATLLGDLDRELPPAAATLMALSIWLQHWWQLLLAVAAIGGVLAATTLATGTGRTRLHAALLTVPALGPLRRAIAAERFLRALHVALRAGTPLVPALVLAREACGDAALGRRYAVATESVLQGLPLTASLAAADTLPPIAIQLLGIGEAGGELAGMAERAATVLARDTERLLHATVRLVEPVLIVFLGALVAFVAGAMFQAVYSLRPGGV